MEYRVAGELRDQLAALLRADPLRWHILGVVHSLNLPDCWVAAGCIRHAVWDEQHGRRPAPHLCSDVDVIYYDPHRLDPSIDRDTEQMLRQREPHMHWSVKNQARMHERNGDAPYADAADAMRHWPETATAVAARRIASSTAQPDGQGREIEIIAPFGLDDLFDLVLRPTPSFVGAKRSIFDARIADKNWLQHWPKLKILGADQHV